ncbi:hypothetical protein QBC39DRAFT_352441 [Podospora conica]|nr:hypothetical protein QBC39DRAFT_352441 [Schizothecium conicum]
MPLLCWVGSRGLRFCLAWLGVTIAVCVVDFVLADLSVYDADYAGRKRRSSGLSNANKMHGMESVVPVLLPSCPLPSPVQQFLVWAVSGTR